MLLDVKDLDAGYGDLQALFGLDFTVADGEAVALIGANGAGKSTLLKTLCGLIQPWAGSVAFEGRAIHGSPAEGIAKTGMALVPEGRMMFASLTVEENLLMGAVTGRNKNGQGPWNLKRVYDLFPVLLERKNQSATRLSGGQQQMVAIGRALMANPKLLLCDEISLGLAPLVVEQVYRAFADIRKEGLAIVLVEQDVARAQRECSRLYCLLKGRVTLQGASADVGRDAIAKAYFG
jgi:branched-chain amino acid transport system ATP-binding protein